MVRRRGMFIAFNIFAIIVVVCPNGEIKDRLMIAVFGLLCRFG